MKATRVNGKEAEKVEEELFFLNNCSLNKAQLERWITETGEFKSVTTVFYDDDGNKLGATTFSPYRAGSDCVHSVMILDYLAVYDEGNRTDALEIGAAILAETFKIARERWRQFTYTLVGCIIVVEDARDDATYKKMLGMIQHSWVESTRQDFCMNSVEELWERRFYVTFPR